MIGRALLVLLTALTASSVVVATTQNVDIDYAILTVTNEHELYSLEKLLQNRTDGASQMSVFSSVKTKVHDEIVGGNADAYLISKQIDDVIDTLDAKLPGFKTAANDYLSENPADMYWISNHTSEASWDFIYGVTKRAIDQYVRYDATPLKAEQMLAMLETLNEEFEALFRSGAALDTKAMVAKIDAFTREGIKIHGMFAWTVVNVGDRLVEEYYSALAKRQQEEEAVADVTTTPPVTETPTATTTAPVSTSGAGSLVAVVCPVVMAILCAITYV